MVDVGGLDDAGRSTLNALGLERGRDGGVQVKEPRAPGTRVCRCFRVRVCWAFVLLLVALACAGVGALPLLLPLYEDRTCLEAATLQAGVTAPGICWYPAKRTAPAVNQGGTAV